MISFWFIIGAMVCVALAFVLIPLLRKPNSEQQRFTEKSRALFQQRINELNQDVKQGTLEAKQLEQSQLELAAGLTDELQQSEQTAVITKRGWLLSIALLLIVPMLAITLYQKIGDSNGVATAMQMQRNLPAIKAAMRENPNKIIARMQSILKRKPDSVKGWVLLGRLYLDLGRFADAKQAFAKARTLKPADMNIALAFVQASYFVNPKAGLDNTGQAIVQHYLRQHPQNSAALNLAALDAYTKGRYQQAISYWERLLAQTSPQTRDGKALLAAITRAQRHLNPQAKVRIKVKVILAKKLLAKLNKDETVFIYAKAAAGPAMPLAIVKKQVKDLPLEVSLTNAMAMLPNMNLSHFHQIRLIARVSKSGNALPQAGDYIGRTPVFDWTRHGQTQQITIAKML